MRRVGEDFINAIRFLHSDIGNIVAPTVEDGSVFAAEGA